MFKKGQGLFEFMILVMVAVACVIIGIYQYDLKRFPISSGDSVKSQKDILIEIRNLASETKNLLLELKEMNTKKKPEADFEIKFIPPKEAKEKVLFKDIPEIKIPDPVVHPDGTIIQPTQGIEKKK